jgi:hypothetical protein
MKRFQHLHALIVGTDHLLNCWGRLRNFLPALATPSNKTKDKERSADASIHPRVHAEFPLQLALQHFAQLVDQLANIIIRKVGIHQLDGSLPLNWRPSLDEPIFAIALNLPARELQGLLAHENQAEDEAKRDSLRPIIRFQPLKQLQSVAMQVLPGSSGWPVAEHTPVCRAIW